MQVQIEYDPLLIEVERSLRQHPKFKNLSILRHGRILADDLMRRRMARQGFAVHIHRDPVTAVKRPYDPYHGDEQKERAHLTESNTMPHGITPEMAATYSPEELERAERNLEQWRRLRELNKDYGTMAGTVQKQLKPNVLNELLAAQLQQRRLKKARITKRH